MIITLFTLMLIFTFFLSKKVFKSYISPLTLFLGNFFFALALFYSIDFINQELSWESVILIISSLVSFTLGSIFVLILRRKAREGYVNNGPTLLTLNISKDDIKIFRVLFLLSFIGFIYFLYSIERQLGLLNVLTNPNLLNLAYANGDIHLNSLPMYMMKLSMVNSMFIFIYILKFRCKSFGVLTMFFIEVLMNVSVKRNILLYIIALNLFIYLYYNSGDVKEKIKDGFSNIKRKVGYLAASLIIPLFAYFFSSTQTLLNKQFISEGSLLNLKLSNSMVTIITYYVANLASLNIYLTSNLNDVPLFGSTLRFLYKIFDRLNILEYNDAFLDLAFVYVPIRFNTTLGQFYIYVESGLIGVILFYSFLGYISTMLYIWYRRKKGDIILMYLAFISTLLLFSIREYILILVDFWILLVVVTLFSLHIKRRKRYLE